MKPGDRIILHTPDNPRLDGQPGVIESLTSWGAFVRTEAAATGQYRALTSEMRLALGAREQGYTGSICTVCQGSRMRRNGSCELCEDCGATSGCS